MGAITQDRFNPIKAFCNVRLQQGVPLVDADVNELDDIRKFEVRTFFKWFVGDGVPTGNDGFHVRSTTDPPTSAATAAVDDFQIYPGDQLIGAAPAAPSPAASDYALRNFGRCIVDGLEVVIQANTSYKGQLLYTGNATATQLSTAWGVPVVAPIPNVAGQVMVYLDVWERVVVADEDKTLVVPPLNTETCARLKREWVVRTRQGNTVPVAGNTDFIAGHSYCALAVINRKVAGTPAAPQPIADGDITDQRRTGLSLASQGGATFSGLVTANGGLTVSQTATFNGPANFGNGLTVTSGMLNANGGVTVPSSSKLTVAGQDVGAAISTLQTTTASQGSTLTSLQTTVSGHTSAISTLQTTTSSQGSAISTLQTTTSSQGSAISTLQTTTASQGTAIGTLQTTVSGHTSSINAIVGGNVVPSGNAVVTLGLLTVRSTGAGSNPTVEFLINGKQALVFVANQNIISHGQNPAWTGP